MTATTTAAARTLRGLGYWLYRYRRTWRGALVMAVFNPLIFLLAIGVGLGHIVDTTGGLPSGQPYLDFFAPGLLAASAMQTALIDSGGVVRLAAMTGGAYKAAMNSPLRPAEIFVGHLLYVGVLSALNASFFVAVMAVLEITGSPWALAMVPVGVLTGVAFAAPMAAFSIIVPNPENISQIYRFVMLPLYLFSGTFFPVETLPAAVRPLAQLLPLWHAVTLCRALNEGTATLLGSAGHVAYLVVMAAAGLIGGRIAYRRVLHP
ncbi:lipooligosaccharide transport system permease protein [Hamadaea flava]|uniref:Transport permease protein n=1 Tax=Hamadaea flava TaxID=1742688 RepID=A0ABV8LPT7_9ACTN|nr:ABC transporter permease [Hamadaea flava]MCP2329574.1 lipooligosaccharide transport system permease protein [Hamadaea flava]